MNDHVYKLIELIGTSTVSVDNAIKHAVQRADARLKNLRWFEVAEIRGHLDQNKAVHWQVKLKVAFNVESEE
jgi:flavin-binding protein dodecin